jgi:hypothetical protein
MRRAVCFLVAGLGVICLGVGVSVLTTTNASAQGTVPPGCRSKTVPAGAKNFPAVYIGSGSTPGRNHQESGSRVPPRHLPNWSDCHHHADAEGGARGDRGVPLLVAALLRHANRLCDQ